jgi:uncharacterized membrane protein (DUF2068 family)
MAKQEGEDKWVRLIGIIKTFKGLLLLAVATGGIKLLHKDVADEVTRWIERLNMDPHNHWFQKIVEKLGDLDSRKLLVYTIGTFFYASLFLVEGIGLIFAQYWAEWVAVIITGSFLPLEIYELIKKFHWFKVGVIIVNAAIVVYLVWKIRHKAKHKQASHA